MSTVTLPAATTCAGQFYIIEVDSASSATLTPTGGDLINGSAGPVVITGVNSIVLYCNGVDDWSLIGN